MAILIVKTDEYANTDAPELLINYILNMEKVSKNIYGGLGISFDDPAGSMHTVKRMYSDYTGKMVEHIILSFDFYNIVELSNYTLRALGNEICKFFSHNQSFFAMHDRDEAGLYMLDKPHFHIALNPTNFMTGEKLKLNSYTLSLFKSHISNLLKKYDIDEEITIRIK